MVVRTAKDGRGEVAWLAYRPEGLEYNLILVNGAGHSFH